MKTYTPKSALIARDWHLIDAKGQVLGRMATKIATLLMGKDKPGFAPHMDTGDHVVVINAADVVVTGRKAEQKTYHRHSGYPGGMKVTTYRQMQAKKPEHIVISAVSGMLPDNRLHDRMLKHLHVYAGSKHPYGKQFKQGKVTQTEVKTES